jgi:hypothetical protein
VPHRACLISGLCSSAPNSASASSPPRLAATQLPSACGSTMGARRGFVPPVSTAMPGTHGAGPADGGSRPVIQTYPLSWHGLPWFARNALRRYRNAVKNKRRTRLMKAMDAPPPERRAEDHDRRRLPLWVTHRQGSARLACGRALSQGVRLRQRRQRKQPDSGGCTGHASPHEDRGANRGYGERIWQAASTR